MPASAPEADSLGDELLRWASEQGSGTRGSLDQAAEHLKHKHRLKNRLSTFYDQLSSLGHLDIDWDNDRWSVAPPTLNLIPGLGLVAVLTGARTYHLEKAFEEAAATNSFYPLQLAQPDRFGRPVSPVGPRAIFVKCSRLSDAEGLAERAQLELARDPAASLTAWMPGLDEAKGSQAAPATSNYAHWFNPTSLMWEEVSDDNPRGLYRQDTGARPHYLWHEAYPADSWWQIGLAEGLFMAIQPTEESPGTKVFRWTPPTTTNGVSSRFEVKLGPKQKGLPSFGHLPTLAERALTVSDGFLPVQATNDEQWLRYRNVSKDVAQTIASKLGQSI